MEPPARIDGARVLAWAWAGDAPFGVVRDTTGAVHAQVYGLAVAAYDDGDRVYRLSCDARWECVQDVDCASVEEAKAAIPAGCDRARVVWRDR